eukprot:scaffold149856_cov21-Tisochrysis_lutea.AAC.3
MHSSPPHNGTRSAASSFCARWFGCCGTRWQWHSAAAPCQLHLLATPPVGVKRFQGRQCRHVALRGDKDDGSRHRSQLCSGPHKSSNNAVAVRMGEPRSTG